MGRSARIVKRSRKLALARSVPTLKLDLACGQNPKADFEGVDVCALPGVKHVVDLQRYPWPWPDNSVAELHSSHYIEHIPMEMIDGQDAFFRFFDECYRILVPDGWMTVVCPCARSNRAFQDPTHRRFIVMETFFYLWKPWREQNGLSHYNVKCNFAGDVSPGVDAAIAQELQLRHPGATGPQQRFQESWNVVLDWHAKLKAIKP